MRILELSGTGLASIPVNPILDSSFVRYRREGKRYAANIALELANVVRTTASARRRGEP